MLAFRDATTRRSLTSESFVDDGWVGDVLSVNVTMIGGGALAHRANEAWMANDAKGANTLTIVAGHTLDHVEYLFGKLTEVSATVGVQVPQWRLVDTGETVEADAPDNILLQRDLGGRCSAVVPGRLGALQRLGMEDGGLRDRGARWSHPVPLPQITPISPRGAQCTDPLAPLDVPVSEPAGLAVPTGPGHNIARSYARMAQAIREGASAEPDFSDAVRVHRLLDSVRASSAKREAIGVSA